MCLNLTCSTVDVDNLITRFIDLKKFSEEYYLARGRIKYFDSE